MPSNANLCLITISGEDRVGLIAEITAYLFDIGADLRDTTFSVLGSGFEFGCLAALDSHHSCADLERELEGLETLAGAAVAVAPFAFSEDHRDEGTASHIMVLTGGDRPGLIAHLSEALVGQGANIVRMSSRRIERSDGGYDYRTVFAVHIPEGREGVCSAAVSNTAGQLGLSYSCREVKA